MIDFRHRTFLELCKVKNYTRTSDILHITQPTVTQHIQYLEEYYGGKLFTYEKKNLSLTTKGKLLYQYTQRMVADNKLIKEIITSHKDNITVSFGATLTIGEFVMPSILSQIMQNHKNLSFHMSVGNTQSLLQDLQNGALSFTLLEGFFDKSLYGYELFSKEEFIAVCSPISPLKDQTPTLRDLLKEQLILRERGSGTRDILERILYEKNLSPYHFKNPIEIGNMSAIKEIVSQNNGITFLYKAAAQKELKQGRLCRILIEDFNIIGEFNFVYLKDSLHREDYLKWFSLFSNREKI